MPSPMNNSNTIGLKDSPAWGRAETGKLVTDTSAGGSSRFSGSSTGRPVRGFSVSTGSSAAAGKGASTSGSLVGSACTTWLSEASAVTGAAVGTASGEVLLVSLSGITEAALDWQPVNAKAAMMITSVNFLVFISSFLRRVIHHLILPH